MAGLKCKMCGGSIRSTGARIGECEDCGTRVLLPLIDEERIINLYNRGNHFREVGEYDRAYSAYESIIAQDRNDAEAHWCLLLCRYGINYVRDDRTGSFRPTISRMNRSPILKDPDYQAALRCSDDQMREWYRKEADRLTDIQNRFLEIMKKEQPYDVFICFKAEEADGSRTRASEIGQDIYEEMTARGLRVFFSRITLENKVGDEFEPYIFSALYTARVMLIVADKPEQLQGRWVKNEWIRFLAMMDQDSAKSVIPVFYGMNPYDFPPEIPVVQGQDMERLGAMQNLVKNVLALCRKAPETIKLITEPEEGRAPFQMENALLRVRQLLEDEDFEAAASRLAEVMEQDAENGEAWYEQLLLDNRVACWQDLMKEGSRWNESELFQKARKYGGDSVQKELDALEAECLREQKYCQMKTLVEKNDYYAAYPLTVELDGYKDDVRQYGEMCRKYIEQRRQLGRCRKEIGDTHTYIERKLKSDYQDIFQEYQKRCRKMDRRKKIFFETGKWPITAAVLYAGIFAAVLAYNNGNLLYTGSIVVFAGVILLSLYVFGKCESLIAGGICLVVLLWVLHKLSFEAAGTIGLVLSAFLLLICISGGILAIWRNKAVNAQKKYYNGTIKPLQEKILEETKRKWAPLVGAENLPKLPIQERFYEKKSHKNGLEET